MPDVTIAMACFRMGREVPRTLQSLAPGYQRNCPPGRIEVILVDNGSPEPPDLSAVAGLGLDITLHHWRDAPASPVAAMNFAAGQARAPIVCAWIDGARMASPGLVDAALAATRLHPRPIVATDNYYLGPDLQPRSKLDGYDEAAEDGLLDSIAWPADGTRLFEIATRDGYVSGDRGMLESNALFLTRAMWNELDGYDPVFREAGGGACNPDLLIRACALPSSQLIRLRGEATFHQVHGGVTSSADDRAIPTLKGLGAQYLRIREKPFAKVRNALIFDAAAGGLVPPALHTPPLPRP